MLHSRFLTFSLATLLGFTAAQPARVHADDTEIYLSSAATSGGSIHPNVLLVLDTSSSMTSTDGTGITRLDRMKQALHVLLDTANNINVGLMRFHRYGGPVLYPVAYIDEDATIVEGNGGSGSDIQVRVAQGPDDAEEGPSGNVTLSSDRLEMTQTSGSSGSDTTVEVRINNGNDDAEQSSGGSMYFDSSDLELVNDAGTGAGDQTIGLRFTGVPIPVGATVTAAEIEFEVDQQQSTSTSLDIYGEAVDDATGFANVTNELTNRLGSSSTSATVSWPGVSAPARNQKLLTPDLTAIVQEIVGRSGWNSGQSMVFFIDGTGKRELESYNGEASAAPLLRVSYTTGPVSVADQIIGLRFQNIAIPQGATVENATIEFEATVDGSGTTDITFVGHAVDDSPAFSATPGELSSRLTTGTGATVNWDGISAWTADGKYQSPDLTAIVQEIVDRSGWCGNNAMTVLVKENSFGTPGLRTAKSYDGEWGSAPVLRVDWDEDSVPSAGGCLNQTVQAQVNSGSDDAEEDSGGTVGLTSSDLELISDGGDQTIGVRFQNLNIPQGVTVLEATLEFTVDETTSGATSLTIAAEDIDDAPTFSSQNTDISGRTPTSATVAWNTIDPWTTEGQKDITPDLSTVVQELVDRGGWAPGNSMAFVITGSGKRVAESYNGEPGSAPVLRIKYEWTGATGTPALTTVRQRLKQIVDDIQYKSGTPIVDTLYEAALYYQGEEVDYGLVRGDQGSRSEYTRVSHRASYTGDDSVRPVGCSDLNLNAAACITEQIPAGAVYDSPITAECQENHIILLSDGSPSVNTAVSRIETMINDSCAGSGSEECGRELVEFMLDEDQSALPGDQNIHTHTIGFELAGEQFLIDLANIGDGEYREASSAGELASVFQELFASILARTSSFAAPSLSVNDFNQLNHRNKVYFGLFKPDTSRRWDGNVKKYQLCDNSNNCNLGELLDVDGNLAVGSDGRITSDAKSFWSSVSDGEEITAGGAGGHVPAWGSRKVYTYTGTNASPTTPVDLGGTDHALSVANSALTKEMLGDDAMTDQDRTDIIEWIRGRDVQDEDGDGSTSDQRYQFSDALHSAPVAVTYGKESNDDDKPVTKLFVGTNDGGIRMLNGYTGAEEWIFYPQYMLDQQRDMMTNANGQHLYGIDGTPTVWTNDGNQDGVIDPTLGEFVKVIVGMRRGGPNYYALDVTPSAAITDRSATNAITPRLMWRIDGGSTNFARLGDTWSQPQLTNIHMQSATAGETKVETVLMFAGGYNELLDSGFGTSTTKGNAIYIVDPDDGSRIWWASNTGSGADLELSSMDYAIPSDLTLIDSNNDAKTDRMYVGDTGGQVWRIDLDPFIDVDTNSGSTGARLAILSDQSDPLALEDQRRFFYAPAVTQAIDTFYSSEARYDMVAIASGNRPTPLNKDVHNRIFALRDYHVNTKIPMNFTPLTANDLYDATANVIQESSDDTVVEAEIDSLRVADGWYITLKENAAAPNDYIGEKGLSRPLIAAGKLFFTTYTPDLAVSSTGCQAAEGAGRLYAMNIFNGGAAYDWDGLGGTDLTKADRVSVLGSGIPSSVSPLFLADQAPPVSDPPDDDDDGDPVPPGSTILLAVGISNGIQVIDPEIATPAGPTYWFNP